MGRLVDGEWTTQWYEPDESGRFVRSQTSFRDRVEPSQEAPFRAEPDRYHLYVGAACPWAHRTLLMRALKGLEHVLDISMVEPFMGDDGWRFDGSVAGATDDKVLGCRFLREVYLAADQNYTGRVTVPVLWDTHTGTIVNNESREIVRMLDHAFCEHARRDVDLAPPELLDAIEHHIDAIYEPVNNGVYRAGFASSQAAYDEAVGELFATLDRYDALLGEQRWLAGERLSEADLFLFTTLIRFDLVYHTHFKCNRRRIVDYPNLWGFVRELYQVPGVAETCNFAHITEHYYRSHPMVNPQRIVPVGPALDLESAHGRERVGGLGARELLGL